jgi:PAS domain S-box-containing protein
MGELIRQHDWSQTPIGTLEEWPQSLRTILSIILNSRFPMFLFWGQEHLCFYNDAYRPSLGKEGKHPNALGKPGAQVWSEIWSTIKPQIDQVLRGGDSTWDENRLLPIYRNGQLEDTYWTCSYSPVIEVSGDIVGVFVTCTETTQSVKSIQQLVDSKDLLEFAIEATELGTWDLNPLTNKFTANNRLKEWFGLRPDEEVDLPLAIAVITEGSRQRVSDAIQRTLQYSSGGQYDIEYTIVHPYTKQERIVRAKGKAWFTESQIAYRFNGTLQDITIERKAQEERAAAQELADMAIKSSGIGLFHVDLISGAIEYTSAYAAIVTGDPAKKELTRHAFADYIHPDDKGIRESANRIGLETGEFYYKTRVVWDDGSVHLISVMGGIVQGENGQPTAYSGTVRDITETEKQAQALREAEERFAVAQSLSEAKFRSLIEEAPVATCLLVGQNMVVEVANEVMLSYWGKDASIIGLPLKEGVPELKGQPFLNILDEVFASGKTYEARNSRAELAVNGVLGTYYFDFTYKPLRNAAGEVYAIMDTAIDVTQQVIARKALEESELFARSIIDHSPVAKAVFIGPDLVTQIVNVKMQEMLGQNGSMIGKPLGESTPILAHSKAMGFLQQVYQTGQPLYRSEEKYEFIKHGSPYTGYYNLNYEPLRDTSGQVYGVVNTSVEITEQVLVRQKVEESEERYRKLSGELEEQVQERTEELATTNEELLATNEELEEANGMLKRSNENLQKFAYVASHDLQEPLRKIQQFGDILKARVGDQLAEGADYLDRMQLAASRMSALIRDLLSFSRISTQRELNALVSLNEVVQTVITDLELVIQETEATVTVGSLPQIQGDVTQLGQLFQNLLSNALKFRRSDSAGVPIAPVVQVTAQRVLARDLPASVQPVRATRTYYRIDVSDNGIGFDEKYLDRIFEVFQRLHGKNQYAGTGIGLAICEKVATNHGGAITASSQPGNGATFSVYFPMPIAAL